VLISGNSSIEHTVGCRMNCSKITNLPFSYYWLPYFAKAIFVLYWPSGKQPIKSLKSISNELLIIIIHSENDPQLSFKDACALYYGLKSQGNNNVYLISNEDDRHLNVMYDVYDDEAVRSILMKHNLLEQKMTINTDLSMYQTDHLPFKNRYNELLMKEKKHERLFYLITVGVFCIVLKIVIVYLNP